MLNVGRNDPCPCGSGKKFKVCHLGREDELVLLQMKEKQRISEENIARLPEVHYGQSRDFLQVLSIKELTGKKIKIKFVDLAQYLDAAGEQPTDKHESGSQIINPKRTERLDPDHIYIAITPDVNASTLIHQLAHVLGFLKGSYPLPGEQILLNEEQHIPVEHIDHPQEFGEWLHYLRNLFNVELDAEDWIVAYLASNKVLIPSQEIPKGDLQMLLQRSAMILNFLREHGEEIDEAIKARDGYIGKQTQSDEDE